MKILSTWSSVPPGGHVVGEDGSRAGRLSHGPAQSEVAHLDVAVRVQQDIGWLDVSVQQVCRVQVLERFQELPDDVLLVDIGQYPRSNHRMQVYSGHDNVSIFLYECR